MSREMKFRAKALNIDVWVHGYYTMDIDWETGKPAHYILRKEFIDGEFAHVTSFIVDPETVGQFTGLKDKNGVEIYEGDIVEIEAIRQTPFDYKTCAVEWFDYGGWVVEIDNSMVELITFISSSAVEVIGNIHENPELLD